MAKVTLNDIANTESSTIVAAVNNNNQLIEDALDNTLSRDGTSPNTMGADLDMNSNSILNLPEPVLPGEAVRKDYVDDLVGGLNDEKLDEAITAYQQTLVLRNETEDFRDEAEQFRDEAASFVGAATSAQRLSTPRDFTYTGDVTGGPTSFDGQANVSTPLTLANNSATNAKLADMSANTIKGRLLTGGDPQDLTGAQVTGLLDTFSSGTPKGAVDRGGISNTTEYLRRDGNWGVPPVGDVPSGTYGQSADNVPLGSITLKWDRYTTLGTAEGTYTVFFANPFPNNCYHLQITPHNPGAVTNEDQFPQIVSFNRFGFSFYLQKVTGGGNYTMTISWLALGN